MAAYAIFIHESTTDAAELAKYASIVSTTMSGHAATLLSRNGALETLEGKPVEGVVLLRFPTMAEAKAWYESPSYRAAAQHRLAGSNFHVLLTEGLD